MKIDRGSTTGQLSAGAPGAASKLDQAKAGHARHDTPGGERSAFKALLDRPDKGQETAPTTPSPDDSATATTARDHDALGADTQPDTDEPAPSPLPADASPHAHATDTGIANHDVDARHADRAGDGNLATPRSDGDLATPRSDDGADDTTDADADAALLAGQPPLQAPAVSNAPVEAAAAAPPPSAVAQVFEKIVQSYQVGSDVRARKVVMLDVDVPGRGGVRVRVSRNGDAVEVRMRADNPELAGLLRAHRDGLYRAGEERGFRFAHIEVVG